jgi:hypothetical protein
MKEHIPQMSVILNLIKNRDLEIIFVSYFFTI